MRGTKIKNFIFLIFCDIKPGRKKMVFMPIRCVIEKIHFPLKLRDIKLGKIREEEVEID